jgi:hypothetical protein
VFGATAARALLLLLSPLLLLPPLAGAAGAGRSGVVWPRGPLQQGKNRSRRFRTAAFGFAVGASRNRRKRMDRSLLKSICSTTSTSTGCLGGGSSKSIKSDTRHSPYWFIELTWRTQRDKQIRLRFFNY